ncbi:MAG: hypothetical protein LBO69_01280 [Ignavibacteria bacterium]|jgi:hypothetical protein|nr:hypothetical protein [Ignavibacteria bacterium]
MNEKHLEFIQDVITRMNTNSFQIKAMAVAIFTGICGIYVVNQINCIFLIGIIPTLLFWFLDAYYLQQERKFREVYNKVAGLESKLNKDIKDFEMPIKNVEISYCKVFWSCSVFSLYLSMIAILILLTFILTK